MISIKLYRSAEDLILGACDKELLGKTFTDGERQIDVSERFYQGDIIEPEELKSLLSDATIANLVGKKTIDVALEMELVDKDSLLIIDDVPHAQIVHML